MEQTLSLKDTAIKYKVAETYFKLNLEFSRETNSKLRRTLDSIIKDQLSKIDFDSSKLLSQNLVYEIEFERGSTKIRIVFFATIANAIIFYGSLKQGVTELYKDAKWLSEQVIQTAKEEDNLIDDNLIRTERRTGLTGRIKRNLERIEQLQNNIQNLTPNQVHEQLTILKQDLSNILKVLNTNERQTFLDNMPNDIRNSLPLPNEKQVTHLYNLYALKPKDE